MSQMIMALATLNQPFCYNNRPLLWKQLDSE